MRKGTMRSFKILTAGAALLLAIAGSGPAQAAIVTVCSAAASFTSIQAAIDDGGTSNGDTISLCAETFSEATVSITKEVTIKGVSPASTTIDSTSSIALRPLADNFTIRDLTISGNSQAVRFEDAGGTIDNTLIENVHFKDNSSRGIELHNATTVTNLTVNDCVFDDNGQGIRSASNSTVEDLTVTDSTFDTHSLHIYQANDGSTGTWNRVTVTGNTFRNATDTAVFAEEIRNLVLDDNDFTDNNRGFTLFKAYDGAGVDVENLAITNNTFTDETQSSIILFAGGASRGLKGTNVIRGNTINADVSVMNANFGKIDIRLNSGFAHSPVLIDQNTVTFSGAFGAGATAAHAIKPRGNVAGIRITANVLNGGNVAGIGGVPAPSGIFLQSDDGFFGPMTGNLVVTDCNQMTGWAFGISVYDAVAGAFGGLPAGADIDVNFNDIAGNVIGVDNSSPSTLLDATGNWWGAADGPSGVGPGSGDPVTANVAFGGALSVTCSEACPDPAPQTQGFWRRVCKKNHSQQLDRSILTEELCADLNPDPHSDPCERARSQAAAVDYNLLSDRIRESCVDDNTGTDVGTTVAAIEALITTGTNASCKEAQALAASINEGNLSSP